MEVNLSRFYRDKGDSVSYLAAHKDGKVSIHKRAVCFNSVLHHPGEYEITCLPSGDRNSAPPLAYQRFFRELHRCGVIPRGVEVGFRNRRNSLTIPQRGWGYHPVFITLSLYRHADCHGKSILGRTMSLYGNLRREGVHFLQCLHWSLVNTPFCTYHSCFNVGGTHPYEEGLSKAKQLKYGIAIAAYGKLKQCEKNKLTGNNSVMMFHSLAKGLKDIRVSAVDEILDPKYAEFYENPDLARK